MLNIFNVEKLKGKPFTIPSSQTSSDIFQCVGVGQNPDGSNYVVFPVLDSVRNRTILYTELIKKVAFEGDLTADLIS